MSQEVQIRPAEPTEVNAIARHLESGILARLQPLPSGSLRPLLGALLTDDCLIVAKAEAGPVGVAGLDLVGRQIIACHLDPAWPTAALAQPLIAAIEQHALRFGVRRLGAQILPPARPLMHALGYAAVAGQTVSGTTGVVSKSLARAAEPWMQAVFRLHEALGIAESYGQQHRFTLVADCTDLESIGSDIYRREQYLHPVAAAAWSKMRTAAAAARIDLQFVSAFRSHDYQAGLIRAKLARGQAIEQILKVSAAPGFSQHHSGRALDLTAPGCPVLEECFAQTAAYQWLSAHANAFGFRETLGKGNRHGIVWEPWHWLHVDADGV